MKPVPRLWQRLRPPVLKRAPAATILGRIGRTVLDLVYPPHCVLCGRDGTFLCAPCTAALPRAETPRCERCWLPDHTASYRCLLWGSELHAVRAPYIHRAGARELVHALKYDGLSVLAQPMGHLLLDSVQAFGLTVDALVPVPLHPRRQRSRGYNQAEVLALAVGQALGLPVWRALRRTRATASQVYHHSAAARARNMAGAFAACEPVAGLTLLLIDDVVTTGSTLAACARALQEAGAAQVLGLTFTREE